jgi:hypothetical protein
MRIADRTVQSAESEAAFQGYGATVALNIGDTVLVHKMEYGSDRVLISWSGTVAERSANAVAVRAIFAPRRADPIIVDGVPLCAGDVFTEYYYLDRWYNVFHIADAGGACKGWYCNVTLPAVVDDAGIAFVDMALDLFVHPEGRFSVLDEDEFASASAELYRAEDAERARLALDELIRLATDRNLPTPSLPLPSPAEERNG